VERTGNNVIVPHRMVTRSDKAKVLLHPMFHFIGGGVQNFPDLADRLLGQVLDFLPQTFRPRRVALADLLGQPILQSFASS
jgi:hypothetical protein